MAKHERLADLEVSDAAAVKVMQVTATDPSYGDLDLDLAGGGRSVIYLLDAQVPRAVCHNCANLHKTASMPPSTYTI